MTYPATGRDSAHSANPAVRALGGLVQEVVLEPAGSGQVAMATERAHLALASASKAAPWTIDRVIHVSSRTFVFCVRAGTRRMAAKVFGEAAAFDQEYLHARLLSAHPSWCTLLLADSRQHVLCYEWLPTAASWKTTDDLRALAAHLGRLHHALSRMPTAAVGVAENAGLVVDITATVHDANPQLRHMLARAYPPGIVPLAAVDLKREHVRVQPRGNQLVQIDLESVRLGTPGLIDLLAVPALSALGEPWPPGLGRIFLSEYCRAADKEGARWSPTTLRDALDLLCGALSGSVGWEGGW